MCRIPGLKTTASAAVRQAADGSASEWCSRTGRLVDEAGETSSRKGDRTDGRGPRGGSLGGPTKGSQHFPTRRRRSGNMDTGGGSGQRAARTRGQPKVRNTKYTTPPELSTHVFSTRGSVISPDYLPLLLILSGDIETNPGPTYPCATCGTTTQRSRQGSLRCPQCGVWTHYNKRCSGVKHRHTIPPGWLCLSCHPTHNITQQPPPATPQQPTPTTPQQPTAPPAPAPVTLPAPQPPTAYKPTQSCSTHTIRT